MLGLVVFGLVAGSGGDGVAGLIQGGHGFEHVG